MYKFMQKRDRNVVKCQPHDLLFFILIAVAAMLRMAVLVIK